MCHVGSLGGVPGLHQHLQPDAVIHGAIAAAAAVASGALDADWRGQAAARYNPYVDTGDTPTG